jgi:DNA modification methylase
LAADRAAYSTDLGAMHHGLCEEILARPEFQLLPGSVQLVFTSPPFALNKKKKYDNRQGQEYIDWLAAYGPILGDLLTDTGSVVIEMGNAWEPGLPVMSTLALEALLAFKKRGGFYLCQQFVAHNPARLPSPAQWVNVKRTRVTDSFTHFWWLSRTPNPKADNRAVLREYSESMRQLLARGKYNAGRRPSEHSVGARSFLVDHGGSIPQNALEFDDPCGDGADQDLVRQAVEWLGGASNFLTVSNTAANDPYMSYCRRNEIEMHPARMNIKLPRFFIEFLTGPSDLVVDPFAGSNTTGAAAEELGRRWLSFEANEHYINGSTGRFPASCVSSSVSP